MIRSLKKPVLSIQGEMAPISAGYPVLQYHVDFEPDLESIFFVLIKDKVMFLADKCKPAEIRVKESQIELLSRNLFSFFHEVIQRTEMIKMEIMTWFKVMTTTLNDLFVFHFDQESKNETGNKNWVELFKYIIIESVAQITRIVCGQSQFVDVNAVKTDFPILDQIEMILDDFHEFSVGVRRSNKPGRGHHQAK